MMPTEGHVRTTPLAWGVVVIAAALMAIGLVVVASASSTIERGFLSWPIWATPFGRQLIFSLSGLAVLMASSRVFAGRLSPEVHPVRWPLWFLLLAIGGLAATFLPGLSDAHRGSHRWLRFPLGSFTLSIQPSELAKFALVAFLAFWLGRPTASPRSFWRGFLPAGFVLAIVAGLVGKEDFGTAVLLCGVGGLLLIVAGCRWLHLVPAGLFAIAGLIALLVFEPYRWERLKAHGDLWSDPRGAGYQPLQSLTSIAAGRWSGVGLGAGIQKYGYLPEAHSDFVFSILCEETGLIGAGLVISLYVALVWLGIRLVWEARTHFERLLAFGIASTMGFQAAMNIAVVTALTPTKGISLPLISAGGSGTLAFCLSLGALAAIGMRAAARSSERELLFDPSRAVPNPI